MSRKNVARGIKLLNEREPEWLDKIDLDMLDLEDSYQCILGQLHGDYANSPIYTELRTGGCREYGFYGDNPDKLTRHWKQAIKVLRSLEVVNG